MRKCDLGLIGLAVMGENLVLNMEKHGYSVAVYNRTVEKVDRFLEGKAKGKNIVGTHTIEELVKVLESPRKIMLMVKAGQPVDDFIRKLLPLLDPGDLIIDGGNSFFKDTIRRSSYLAERSILYIGTGISGGEEGALKGPAIMPGGQLEAYRLVEPIFTKIAAQVDGIPCCSYIGPDGAGHYVKMTHNGIEYGDMELISEAYNLMKNALRMNAEELHQIFSQWNQDKLNSYLIEITADIFAQMDTTGNSLVEMVLDEAAQKGTGKWTSQSALDLGIPAPTIAEAVFARCISALKDERIQAAKVIKGPARKYQGNKTDLLEAIKEALYAAKICSYAQGFALMKEAGKEYGWNLNLGKISMIWRGGCVIRARFLQEINEAFTRDPNLTNLLLDPYFKEAVEGVQDKWRKVVITAIDLGIPVPAFSSALAYFDSYRTARLPANLIQAQRDYFGAHTYRRIDQNGVFHTEWMLKERPEVRIDK
ncbi:MAG: decarboxylating NADP(+)-dependent phosphogluconate dehydrogenase [bacterium]